MDWDQLVTFVNFWFVLRKIVLALFVLRILSSLIVLKADLEGPSSQFVTRTMLERLIRNTNQKLTKSYELVPVTLSYILTRDP